MKNAFFHNAELLWNYLGITPLLYGSLGLELITGESLNADDIDVLVPEAFLTDRWTLFRSFLESKGYKLTDEHEHSFEKDGIAFSYASLEELEVFAGVPIDQIEIRRQKGIPYRILSLSQYLSVYRASEKDGYRINVRKKKDAEKIAFIESRLAPEGFRLRNMTSLYIVLEDGLLLLRRNSGIAKNLCTGTAGGHFEPKEMNDPFACLLRETKEELGLKPEDFSEINLRYIALKAVPGEVRQNYYYFAKLREPQKAESLVSNEGELTKIKFEDILALPMPFCPKFVLDHWLSVGRFDKKLYGGTAEENDLKFSPMI